jgi:hypothetical protein
MAVGVIFSSVFSASIYVWKMLLENVFQENSKSNAKSDVSGKIVAFFKIN